MDDARYILMRFLKKIIFIASNTRLTGSWVYGWDFACNNVESDHFPVVWKEAIVTHSLKKYVFDSTNFKILRPVSNLSYISKLRETAVADQIQSHLAENNLHRVF